MTVRFDFAGQTVLVTGGAQGIGRSIVEGFAVSGARVLIADLQVQPAQALAHELQSLGHEVQALAIDLADEAAIGALLGGLHNSQRVLLALTQAGVSREDAYRLVQRNAMAVWASAPPRAPDALLVRCQGDAEITAVLSPDQLAACFDDAHHFARVDEVLGRVFGS